MLVRLRQPVGFSGCLDMRRRKHRPCYGLRDSEVKSIPLGRRPPRRLAELDFSWIQSVSIPK